MRVTFSREAEEDLAEVAAFIAEDSPRQAGAFVLRLSAVCLALAEAPQRFQVVLIKDDIEIRRATHGRYSIFYTVRLDEVYVLHILHGARDYARILFPGG